MSNIINRFSGIAVKGQPFRTVALLAATPDDIGTGCLVTATMRAKVGPSMGAIVGGLTRAGCYPIAKGHGLRWMLPDGSASPCFTERVGNVEGAVYLYSGKVKEAAFFAALKAEGLPSTIGTDCKWVAEGGSKNGAKYNALQPLTDAQADALVRIMSGVGFTATGGGEGFNRDPLLGKEVQASATPATDDAPPADATPTDAHKVSLDKPKGGKRAVKHA